MGRGTFVRFVALASAAAIVAAACGSVTVTNRPSAARSAAQSAAATVKVASRPTPTWTPCVPPTPYPGARSGGGGLINVGGPPHVLVRWFVGLGPGEQPAQITFLQNVVSDFNALQDKRTDGVEPVILSLEIVQHGTAIDILRTEISSCNAPDLIGPMDVGQRAAFPGEFIDMTPQVAAAGYDLSQYPAGLLDATRDGRTGALLGLPFGVIPSVLFYNKDLFDRAGLQYPPQKAGDPYVMPGGSKVPWTWDAVRSIAKKLSLDSAGKDATQLGFDPTKQIQFGFEFQAAEGLNVASVFGGGSLLAPDGRTAQFPDAWKAAWTWYYNGIWTDHMIAGDSQQSATPAGGTDPVFFCCSWAGAFAANDKLRRWDIAAMPANAQGVISAPLEVETFGIDRNSQAPQRAFEALTYLMSRPDLLAVFGGAPYVGDQLAFYHKYVDPQVAGRFPGNKVNWQVAVDMAKFGDVSRNQTDLPNFAQAQADYDAAFSTLTKARDVNTDRLFSVLVTELQADFDAAR
jgi:multiple sugar transport system substrate-binding protein